MGQKEQELYLIDGSAYIYRAYHAMGPLSNSQGSPTGAIFGFTNMIVKTLKDYDWDPTWIPEKKIIGVIGEREAYSLQFRWAKPGDPSDWGISVNYSGTKRQVWDFPAEYSIPSESLPAA